LKGRIVLLLIVLLACIESEPSAVSAYAQESTPVEIKLSRELGFGLGGQIQGRFSIKADGPVELNRVEFYIDDQLIAEDRSPPFSARFNTGDFEGGVHQLTAIGFTSDGRELLSNRISRQFVSVQNVVLIVGTIIVLVVGLRLASHYFTRGKHSNAGSSIGYLGGTVCSSCGRSFGIHWWSMRLGFGRLDRCPHCGKWSMVSRSSAEALAAAEQLESEPAKAESNINEQQAEDDEILRRQIDESRYSDK
jgi:hypothetical protein